jgi:5-methylcytosine-specific restriction protein B
MNEALYRDILRVLCRLPVHRGQLSVYRLAIEHPGGFTSAQVRERMGYDQAQQRGLMSAFAVRINNTPRETSVDAKPGLGLLFKQKWDGHQNTYTARPELLQAIQQLEPLREFTQKSPDELGEHDWLPLQLPASVDAHPPAAALPGGSEPATPVSAPNALPFEQLLDSLDASDLVYPTELVANLLLALQVKRFVILTGISGTGKTRIAQVLADRFAVRRTVVMPEDPGDAGALITVRPYMLIYNRMVLPQALAVQVPGLLEKEGSGTLRTRWPGGELDLTIWRGTALTVMFRGEVRRWFEANFAEGNTFLARLEGDEEGTPRVLALGLAPTSRAREERVQNTVVMAVRPDWTDHRGLLGGFNPLTRQYLSTPFLRLLLQARDEVQRAQTDNRQPAPFFLILDEMNLARVEHYFADFLSALESGEELHLHDSTDVEEGLSGADEREPPVPRSLQIPPNVFFLGTVNVDESTYLFSPKVLDRAFTIELNAVDLGGLSTGIQRGGDLVLAGWNGRLDPPTRPGRPDWQWLEEREDGALAREVQAIHGLLAQHNRHFGYRVATELARFVRLAAQQAADPGAAAWAALDLAILQKVLVKLHGTRHELVAILEGLLRFTLVGAMGTADVSDLTLWTYRPDEAVVRRKDEAADLDAVFPRSAAKLWRMLDRLRETGFTSWIE